MKLAIVGVGSIGTRHLKNALALGCEVFACESDDERRKSVRAHFPSIHVFDELGLLGCVQPCDAWLVCTPYDKHLFWAQEAVRRRIPVFVEKPLGSLDQIEDWRALVKASEGLTTQVGYQCRWHPKARAMKLLFPQPQYGTFGCRVDVKSWPGQSYGPLWLEASHDLDLALWMGAETSVDSVTPFGANLGAWTVDVSEGAYIRWWSVGGDSEGASVEFNLPEELGDQMYVDELQHFLDCVQEGIQTECPLFDGLRVLEVCQQIEQMARASV